MYVFADKTVIKDSTNTVGRRAGGIEEESTSKMDAKMCFAIFKVINLFNISLTLIVCYFHIYREFNPIALRTAKTWSFGPSECKRINGGLI